MVVPNDENRTKEEAVEKLDYDQQDLSLCTQWSKDGSAPMMQ